MEIFNYICATALFLIVVLAVGNLLDGIVGFLISVFESFIGSYGVNIIYNYAMFIGVIFHELSHAVVAAVLGAKVTKVCFYKVSHKDGRLGYVVYIPRGPVVLRSLQMCLSAMAPALCGLSFTYMAILAYWNGYINTKYNILFYYIVASVFCHSRLSNEDMQSVLKGLPVCYLVLLLIFWYFKLDISTILNWGMMVK